MHLYPDDILTKLDFDNITNTLAGFCKGDLARKRCHSMKFFTQKDRVDRLLEEVDECQMAIVQKSNLPLFEYFDISDDLFLLKKENYVLEVQSIANIIDQVRMINELVQYAKVEQFDDEFPNIAAIIAQVEFEPLLIKRFDEIFDIDNTIKPTASPALMTILKKIDRKEKEILKQFEAVASKYAKEGLLTDNVESYRNGRRVLSVNATNKRKIDGIIHDESKSGHTVFIEPQQLTVLHNDLYDFESEKRQEIYRILKELCAFLRPFAPTFDLWQKIIVRLDFIQAKAKLAILMNGAKPKINNEGQFFLKEAYNPYLILVNATTDKETVPFNMGLDRDTRFLIISGPNAGGKSVTMKAVGIIILMVQCGLLPPVDPDSSIGLPRKLMCDIGDQQSIEDDLSTYSSRLKNMLKFIKDGDKNTFVLIDEFGSGTDPQDGGALAEAILHRLHQKKVQGVITTHYSNIKLYSYNTKGMANAAMIFDQKKLAPTYKMLQGKPGSSFAFEIANKIGLPKDIVNYARKKSGKHSKAIDELLSDLQHDRKELEQKLKKAEEEKRNLQKLLSQYEVLHSEFEVNKRKLKVQIKEHNYKKLDDENRELQSLVKELRKEKDLERAEKKLKKVKAEKAKVADEIKVIEDQLHKIKDVDYSEMEVGDWIKLKSGGLLGKILDISNKRFYVQVGDMTIQAKPSDIIPSKYVPIETKQTKAVKTDLVANVDKIESKLDIRGYRKSEAEEFIREFMDQAFLSNFDILTVVHGKGSGVLKKTLLQKLKEYDGVKRYYHPEDEFGGDGVTLIEI